MANIPDTFGWDTVFAISIDKVNDYLASVPASAPFSVQDDVTGSTARLDWSFENWRITDTPVGSRIEVTLDFGPGSTISISGGSGTQSTSLDPPLWTCVVTFGAHFDGTDPATRRLVARTAQGQDWASVRIETEVPNTAAVRLVLQGLISKWFKEAPEAVELFEQEFATVNIGNVVAGEGLDWLKPQVVAFAGGVMADQVTKALGILAMTGPDRNDAEARASQATLQLSPYAIPANATSGFIISARLVLRYMLMPACAGTFGGDEKDPTKHFEIYGEGTPKLRNRKALDFKQDLDGAQRGAHVRAEGLDFSFEGERLRLRLAQNVATHVAGLSLDATIDQAYIAILMDKPDASGETVFLLANDGHRKPEVTVVREPWVTGVQAAAESLVLALTAALAVVSFRGPLMRQLDLDTQAARIWARVIAAVFAVVGTTLVGIPNYIEWALQGQVHSFPDFGKFLNKAYLDRIGWPGGETTQFQPTTVSFANGLQIAIEPIEPT
jgi:Clostridium P-47 protein